MAITSIKTRYRNIRTDFSLSGNHLHEALFSLEPHSVANTIPLTWKKAKDFSVWDDKGNKFIDLTSGIFVANAGHANPAVKRAIKKQLDDDLLFAYNYPTEIKYQFIKKLLAISPRNFDRAVLLNSGSEAVDIAYKLIKLYGKKTGKKYIVAFKGNYHGRGLSNDLISGNKERAISWSGVFDDAVVFLDFPYNKNDRFDPKKLPPAGDIAGFVVETFQGWGAWFYPDGYLNELQKFAKENGALVCFDEMQSGFYRLGPVYGYMTYGRDIEPDIICLGKGIASSLPLSATLSRADIVDIDEKADLHGTFSGTAVCCAAGLANLEFLSSGKQVKARRATEKTFGEALRALEGLPGVTAVNVRGFIAGIVTDTTERATAIVRECAGEGVLPVCTNKNAIKIAPPLTITSDAITEAIGVVRDVIGRQAGR